MSKDTIVLQKMRPYHIQKILRIQWKKIRRIRNQEKINKVLLRNKIKEARDRKKIWLLFIKKLTQVYRLKFFKYKKSLKNDLLYKKQYSRCLREIRKKVSPRTKTYKYKFSTYLLKKPRNSLTEEQKKFVQNYTKNIYLKHRDKTDDDGNPIFGTYLCRIPVKYLNKEQHAWVRAYKNRLNHPFPVEKFLNVKN